MGKKILGPGTPDSPKRVSESLVSESLVSIPSTVTGPRRVSLTNTVRGPFGSRD